MLTADRQQMTTEAIQGFMLQSYPKDLLRLILWDTGKIEYAPPFGYDHSRIEIFRRKSGGPIGALRNAANAEVKSDVIVTMDSDDWSGNERIADQVHHLIASGADCTAYREVVFWAEQKRESWLYTDRRQNFGIGGSLCYWHRAWQCCKFDPHLPTNGKSTSEYYTFLTRSKVYSVTSLSQLDPMLVCRIHQGNSSDYSFIWDPRLKQTTFRRAPAFDEYCAGLFAK